MFTHDSVHRSLRRRLRPVILLAGAAWLALGVMVGPASADTPEAWETPPEASPFGYVLILLIIPLGAAALHVLLSPDRVEAAARAVVAVRRDRGT